MPAVACISSSSRRAEDLLLLPTSRKLHPHIDQLHRRKRPGRHPLLQSSGPAHNVPVPHSPSSPAKASPTPAPPPPPPASPASPPHPARGIAASPPACNSRHAPHPRSPAPGCCIGANTADRVPTTTRASPRRIRCHCSARSSGVNPECSSATSSPERRHHLPRHRRRQPNLRHQQQRTLPRIESPPHRRKIHRRLPRPGHPIQQQRPNPPFHRRRNRTAAASICSSFNACSCAPSSDPAATPPPRLHPPAPPQTQTRTPPQSSSSHTNPRRTSVPTVDSGTFSRFTASPAAAPARPPRSLQLRQHGQLVLIQLGQPPPRGPFSVVC